MKEGLTMKIDKDFYLNSFYIIGFSGLTFTLLFLIATFLFGCTMSFQNISTNGKANDLVDEEQTSSPDVQTDAQFPPMTGML